jgi:signal transduction histidine kinase
MKSIRLSLIVYFLLLLACALGAVSYFYYQTTSQTLRDKEQRTEELLRTRHKHDVQAIHAKLDQQLLKQAQTLARQTFAYRRGWEHTYPLDLVAALATPGTTLAAPVWIPDPTHTFPTIAHAKRLQPRALHPFVHLESANEVVAEVSDPETKVYFQTFTKDGWPLETSESLADDSFTLDQPVQRDLKLFKENFDDVTLPSGVKVRRVTLHVTVPHFSFNYAPGTVPQPSPPYMPWTRKPGGKGPPKGFGGDPKQAFRGWRSLTVFVQYASDVHKRDRDVDALNAGLDRDLARLNDDSQAALADLQRTVLWVAFGTFAALVLGGYLLVWLGLIPLKRLSVAVSRVSARDFRLEIDDRKMPRELQPIVARLKQTLDLLKRAFAREKQAAADISHELRTPLAALMTTLEVGLRKQRSAEEYREMLEDCRASGQQMNQLVERLLKLARLDAGADTVRPREIDVAVLADQCASLVRPLVEARGLVLRVHHQGPAILMADPDKIREVVTNLLHNAIQYNRPNGSIDMMVGTEDGELRIEVCDTGIGISAEVKQRIFERFYRSDPSRHAEGLHAGLGLAIVKGYVDLMGGHIEVESKEGEGTLFRVCLPVRPGVTRAMDLAATVNPGFAVTTAQPGA